MAKSGYQILDSDMHVFEPHDLYLKYMNPKWGDRIPRGRPRTKHGQIRFTYADGTPIRSSGVQALSGATPKPVAGEAAPGEDMVADRYAKPLKHDYDAISQLEAMDEIDRLAAAARAFEERAGRTLTSWSDLIAAGYLGGVPLDSTGHQFRLDAEHARITLAPASPLNPLPTEPIAIGQVPTGR